MISYSNPTTRFAVYTRHIRWIAGDQWLPQFTEPVPQHLSDKARLWFWHFWVNCFRRRVKIHAKNMPIWQWESQGWGERLKTLKERASANWSGINEGRNSPVLKNRMDIFMTHHALISKTQFSILRSLTTIQPAKFAIYTRDNRWIAWISDYLSLKPSVQLMG